MVISCTKRTELLYSAAPHQHSAWEIIYTCAGNLTERIGDTQFSVEAGDISVIPPGVIHSRQADEGFCDMYMQADSAVFSEMLIVHDRDNSILSLMHLMHRQMTEREYNYRTIADGLYQVICQTIRQFAQLGVGNSAVIQLKNELYQQISNVQFDLQSALANCGYSPNHMRSCFTKEVGMPPLKYLTYLRIGQAKALLIQDDFISVSYVAAECGFSDSLYFSTCFKQHVGLSPLAYRKEMRKNPR